MKKKSWKCSVNKLSNHIFIDADLKKGSNLSYEIINLENPMLINKGFASIIKTKFHGQLDGLVMCHGVFSPGKLIETLIDAFDTTLNTNVRSSFHFLSLCTPFLKLTKGNVVILSSIYGKLLYKDSFLESLSNVSHILVSCYFALKFKRVIYFTYLFSFYSLNIVYAKFPY